MSQDWHGHCLIVRVAVAKDRARWFEHLSRLRTLSIGIKSHTDQQRLAAHIHPIISDEPWSNP